MTCRYCKRPGDYILRDIPLCLVHYLEAIEHGADLTMDLRRLDMLCGKGYDRERASRKRWEAFYKPDNILRRKLLGIHGKGSNPIKRRAI